MTKAEVDKLLATRRADLAVVAAWAVHDQIGRRAKQVTRAVIETISTESDPELCREMLRAMISMLGDALANQIEELLMTPLAIDDSLVYLRIVAALEARGEARALLRLLAARGFTITASVREQVACCTDLATLDGWVQRAATATTLEEVFAALQQPTPGSL